VNRQRFLILVVICACLAAATLSLSRLLQAPTTTASLSVAELMQDAGDDNFERASVPREFIFPEDFGPHDSYRTEWWYFTGNLEDEQGNAFGYQLTFFRYSPTSKELLSGSAWRTRQIYMAHFAVSDIRADNFHSFERFSRSAAGLAGSSNDTLHVWLDKWSAQSTSTSGFPLRLRAREDDIEIDLVLEQGKPMVLQGDRGLSIKNREVGNASYYYSFTRMPSSGTVRIKDHEYQVSGLSWMDREWSTSALGPDQLGWDWFALQLSDGSEVMLYRFRRSDNKTDPWSYGVLVSPEGQTQTLAYDAFNIEVLDYWKSPRDGNRYPAKWQLRIPQHNISLLVKTSIADQEHNLSFRYWEGAVEVQGEKEGEDVSGRGYVELTGYVERGKDRANIQ
jgi:predicted secreted hydrolase